MGPDPAPWALRGVLVAAVLYLLRDARDLLAPVVVAVVLTFMLAPLVRALRRIGLPEMVGSALVVTALLATIVPLGISLAQPAVTWWERAPQTIARVLERIDRLRAAIPGLADPATSNRSPGDVAAGREPRPAAPDPLKERLTSEGVAWTGALLGRGVSVTISATATLILLYFLLASEHWILSRCVEAVPRRRARALVLGGLRAAQREIGRYLVSVGLINLGSGIATGIAVWWLGLPNPTLWATVVAILNFIPYIGPLIIVTALALAGIFTFSGLPEMLGPALAFLLIHAVESNLVSPWVVGRRLALSPISVFLSVMFWGWLWGIAGALIAVPILIGMRSVARRAPRLKPLSRFLDGDTKPVPSLRSLIGPRRGWRRATVVSGVGRPGGVEAQASEHTVDNSRPAKSDAVR